MAPQIEEDAPVPYYRAVGEVPTKRHRQAWEDDGRLRHEELMGTDGFGGESALLYHRFSPAAIVAAEPWEPPGGELRSPVPLLPRHLRTGELAAGRGRDLVVDRQLLLGNDDIRVSIARASLASPLYRNALGDECVFVHQGRLRLESTFGVLDAAPGDYVVVPTSTTHRWVPLGDPVIALVIEASGHIRIPDRYLSPRGQLLESAPYCERDFRAPTQLLREDAEGVTVLVRHEGGGTAYTYAHHPFDVVGWDGYLYPFAFPISAFEPRVGRYHLPPPTHQTFEGPGFVVCSFCPRPYDFGEDAIPVPYAHANVDADEVIYYVAGDFMSRRGAGIGPGSISLHPAGFVHGPQPGSVEAALGRPGTDELAVMIDTVRPLRLAPAALACDDPAYPWSWAGGPLTGHRKG